MIGEPQADQAGGSGPRSTDSVQSDMKKGAARRRAPCQTSGVSDQAGMTARRRYRIAPPTRPKPAIIIAQLAGSGTAAALVTNKRA